MGEGILETRPGGYQPIGERPADAAAIRARARSTATRGWLRSRSAARTGPAKRALPVQRLQRNRLHRTIGRTPLRRLTYSSRPLDICDGSRCALLSYTRTIRSRCMNQLAERIREQIAAGVLQPGDRLPSANEISDEAGISRMTVRQAIDYLVRQGFVVVRHGAGTFVAAPKLTFRSVTSSASPGRAGWAAVLDGTSAGGDGRTPGRGGVTWPGARSSGDQDLAASTLPGRSRRA